jgi:hypothetical protein
MGAAVSVRRYVRMSLVRGLLLSLHSALGKLLHHLDELLAVVL